MITVCKQFPLSTINTMIVFLCLIFSLSWANVVYSQINDGDHDEHEEHEEHHDDDHEDHGEHEGEAQGPAIIAQAMADRVGIKVEKAGAGSLQQTVNTYGKLNTSPEQVSHVRARFPGIITSVTASIGDTVTAGALLAEVESNESLKKYRVTAPIAGLVTMRHANVGEVTQDQMLFEIASFDPLWAELRIFPTQQDKIKPGQVVFIVLDKQRIEAVINNILPARDGQPYFIARVAVKNTDNTLSPGLMTEGHVVTEQFDVELLVKNSAIQTMNELEGVFVKEGDDSYEFKPLVLGRRDAISTEVLSGMEVGEEYVIENSYLIKADIMKATAEHDH